LGGDDRAKARHLDKSHPPKRNTDRPNYLAAPSGIRRDWLLVRRWISKRIHPDAALHTQPKRRHSWVPVSCRRATDQKARNRAIWVARQRLPRPNGGTDL